MALILSTITVFYGLNNIYKHGIIIAYIIGLSVVDIFMAIALCLLIQVYLRYQIYEILRNTWNMCYYTIIITDNSKILSLHSIQVNQTHSLIIYKENNGNDKTRSF